MSIHHPLGTVNILATSLAGLGAKGGIKRVSCGHPIVLSTRFSNSRWALMFPLPHLRILASNGCSPPSDTVNGIYAQWELQDLGAGNMGTLQSADQSPHGGGVFKIVILFKKGWTRALI